jgi:hypothetical protein
MALAKLKDQEIIDALRDGPLGADLMKKRNAELTKRRGELCAKLELLIAPAGEEYARLTALIDKATIKFDQARKASDAAQRELLQARQQRASSCHSLDAQRSEIEAELRASAHPEIAEFRVEMLDEHARLAREHPVIERDFSRSAVTGLKIKDEIRSSAPLIGARMQACRDAMIAAEALQLAPDQTKVPAELQKLRDGLPSTTPQWDGAAR